LGLRATLGLELDELERPGADRTPPHLGGRHVARIDRREPRGEQRQEGGLRAFQPERHLVVGLDDDAIEVAVPGLAWIDAQRLASLALQQIPGAFDVTGAERPAVVPFDALAQFERDGGPRLVPRPGAGEIGHDGLQAALRHALIVHHQVVEDAHHRPLAGDGGLLVDRHAGRAVEEEDLQDAARFLRGRRPRRHRRQHHDDAGENGL